MGNGHQEVKEHRFTGDKLMKVRDIYELINNIAPFNIQENWDNSGLILGDMNADVNKIIVALDASEEIVEQAIQAKADLLITHHPLLFGAIKQINSEDYITNKVLRLAKNNVNVISCHTNIDKTALSDVADEMLNINRHRCIEVDITSTDGKLGIGTIGKFLNAQGQEVNITLREAVIRSKNAFQRDVVNVYGDLDSVITKVAVCTGSGKSMIEECIKEKCDLLITGDITYHAALDAYDQGLNIIDASHYGTEIVFVDLMIAFLEMNLKDIKLIRGMQTEINTFM